MQHTVAEKTQEEAPADVHDITHDRFQNADRRGPFATSSLDQLSCSGPCRTSGGRGERERDTNTHIMQQSRFDLCGISGRRKDDSVHQELQGPLLLCIPASFCDSFALSCKQSRAQRSYTRQGKVDGGGVLDDVALPPLVMIICHATKSRRAGK
jgi:hypothetical protein